MNTGRWAALGLVTAVAGLGLSGYRPPAAPSGRPPQATSTQTAAVQRPISFEPNVGQAPEGVRYVAHRGKGTLSLSATESVITGPNASLHMRLLGANPDAPSSGVDPLPGKLNYLRGNDPAKWQTNVSTYARVAFHDVYPGIDVTHYGSGADLEYDFVIAAGADPGAIAIAADGATAHIEANGDLVMKSEKGQVRQLQPVAYQESVTGRRSVPARFQLTSSGMVRLVVGEYDRSRALVIDPLIYASPLGGDRTDTAYAITVDASGAAFVAGTTASTNFPTTPGALDSTLGTTTDNGLSDVFVTKVNPAGSALEYSTYLGGDYEDRGYGVAVDSAGHAFVSGATDSPNFPATTFGGAAFGGQMAFVAKLNDTGSGLLYSRLLCTGGPSPDPSNSTSGAARGIALDQSGSAYLAGYCNGQARTLPTTPGAIQTTLDPSGSRFVAKLDPSGSLAYATALGPPSGGATSTLSIAVDVPGNAYVAGPSGAGPTVNKVNADGSALLYSKALGGGGSTEAHGVAVDASGSAYITGTTEAQDFPVTRTAFQRTKSVGRDAFVTKLNPAGSRLTYSTFFGGSIWDEGNGIAVDDSGSAHIVGQTTSSDLPMVDPIVPTKVQDDRNFDNFVADFNPDGSALSFSTYLLGGSPGAGEVENPFTVGAIAVDANGNDYVASVGGDLTQAPFQAAPAGGATDAWVAKMKPGGRRPPQVDFNGDNLTDIGVFRAGQWLIQGQPTTSLGADGDMPASCDLNQDPKGIPEKLAFRPADGSWRIDGVSGVLYFGMPGDLPVPADYDYDGYCDFAVFRPSTGAWYVRDVGTTFFGLPGDIPVPNDYNGDGKVDFAVFRPSTGAWYVRSSGGGPDTVTDFGLPGDISVPGDYDGDGHVDAAVFRPSSGTWYIHPSGGGPDIVTSYGLSGDVPVPGDYDGDGTVDIAVFRPESGAWFMSPADSPSTYFGLPGDEPLPLPSAIQHAGG